MALMGIEVHFTGLCWAIWLLIGVFLAWWTYNDAKHRTNAAIAWAVLVLLLPILGLLLYVLLRPDPQYPPTGAYPYPQYPPPQYGQQYPPPQQQYYQQPTQPPVPAQPPPTAPPQPSERYPSEVEEEGRDK